MLMLVLNITLALTFNSSNDARPRVSDCFRFYPSLISEILEVLGTSSFAGTLWLAVLECVSNDCHCVS